MTRSEQKALWLLESKRSIMELEARFLLDIKRRGLKPSPAQFRRWWRRKRREAPLTALEMNFLIKAIYSFEVEDMLNNRNPLSDYLS